MYPLRLTLFSQFNCVLAAMLCPSGYPASLVDRENTVHLAIAKYLLTVTYDSMNLLCPVTLDFVIWAGKNPVRVPMGDTIRFTAYYNKNKSEKQRACCRISNVRMRLI